MVGSAHVSEAPTEMRCQRFIASTAAASACALTLLVASTADAQPSALKLKGGEAGCTSESGDGTCADGVALHGAGAIAFSPDGRNAYVANQDSDSVVVFNRDTVTGALTEKSHGTWGCISESGTAGECADGRALDGAETVAVSGDGENVYVASRIDNAVAVFDRNPANGRLTEKPGRAGCLAVAGTTDGCAIARALDGASTVVVSGDGENVYVASRHSNALASFDRDSRTGALAQKPGLAGCISEDGSGGACADGSALEQAKAVTVSPDGSGVYVAASDSGAVAIFDRSDVDGRLTQLPGVAGCISENGSGGCADGNGLLGAGSVAVAPDGTTAYVASELSNSITTFDRDPLTGALRQRPGTAGCIAAGVSGCAGGNGLLGARSVVVAPDGLSVYGASIESDAVTVFDRDAVTGALRQPTGKRGCFNEEGVSSCAAGHDLDGAESVAVSADGDDVYAAAALADAVVGFDRGRPPNTTIVKAPKRKLRTRKRTVTVSISFQSEAGATFRCRRDASKYRPCTSPWATTARSRRGRGKHHRIRVWATDYGGNAETEAASVSFRVIRR